MEVPAAPTRPPAPTSAFLRGGLLNLGGQVLSMGVVLLALPLVVQRMGDARYGLYAITILLIGSASLLELGLGKSTTKFVAEYRNAGREADIGGLVWGAFTAQLALGLLLGGLLALLVPWLVPMLNVPAPLQPDARRTLWVLAAAFPVVLATSSLRGALEGVQRYEWVNGFKIVTNLATYLVPLGVLVWSGEVWVVVAVVLAVRTAVLLGYLRVGRAVVPGLGHPRLVRGVDPNIRKFAGWVAFSNLLVPLITQLDRYLIASLISLSAVTYFALPGELFNGLTLLPSSLAAVLLPVFSGLSAATPVEELRRFFFRAVRLIFLVTAPAVLGMAVFSHDVLLIWQGPVVASRSASVLTWLVLALPLTGISWVPLSWIMSQGRADWATKCQLAQVPVYVPLLYFLLKTEGMVGAAMATTIRLVLEACVYFWLAGRLTPALGRGQLNNLVAPLLVNGLLLGAFLGIRSLDWSPWPTLLAAAGAVGLYGVAVFFGVVRAGERAALGRMVGVSRKA